MNVLEFKNGDIVTLTALYDDDGGGRRLTKLLNDDDDTNIYADAGWEVERMLFLQYNGNNTYKYISCQLDKDSHSNSFTIRDFKIESKEYPLSSGWGAGRGLSLVELFKPNRPVINWNALPWSDVK